MRHKATVVLGGIIFPREASEYIMKGPHILEVVLGACFAFILVEFVLFMILALILSKGGNEYLRNGEFAFLMIMSGLLTTAIAYYYLMATLDDTCVMFCN